MKKTLLLMLLFLPFISFAQVFRTIEAPTGLLRNKPQITAPIIFHIQEKHKVKVLEQTNQHWVKVEYRNKGERIVGYITNQTLSDTSSKRENWIAKNQQKSKKK
jgi:uncharacterized protein YgiM (DUF1202 family)